MARRPAARLDEEGLWKYALRALGGRDHSVAELRDKLRRRAAQSAQVETVLRRLKQAGYLNEPRFAVAFAAARRDSQGLGQSRVLRDLRRKRVAPAVAEKAVREVYREIDEVALIEGYLERKFRRTPLAEYLGDQRRLASVYRKLRLAGFSSGNSIRVLRRYSEQAQELAETEEDEQSSWPSS